MVLVVGLVPPVKTDSGLMLYLPLAASATDARKAFCPSATDCDGLVADKVAGEFVGVAFAGLDGRPEVIAH